METKKQNKLGERRSHCPWKTYLNSETSTVTMVTPAEGPSLPTAPAGKWI